MSNMMWILFTIACGAGLLVTVPVLMIEMGREVRRDAVEE